MATLAFRVQADYEKVIRLREEINRLKQEIGNINAVMNPTAFNVANQKLQQATNEFSSLTTKAAEAGAEIEGNFKQKIYNASQTVNGLTEEIIKQKKIIAETKDAIRTLSEQYSSMGKYEKSVSPVGAKLKEAKDSLAEQKYALFELTQQQAEARLSVKKLRDEFTLMKDDSEGASVSISSIVEELKGMTMGALGGFGIKEFIGRVVQVRGEFAQMESSLKVLLGGSESKLKSIMGEIKQYALESPLNTKDMVGAVQTMTGFGLDADKSVEYLKAIGDVSMGNAQKFNSLTLAFSQMSAAGKLMGQDLNQMVNAGFNPLEEISRKTGKSIGELKEEMSKGAISAKMVQDAFISVTSEGGKFYGMANENAKTLNGQISMLEESFDNMFNEIGEKGEGVMMKAIQSGTFLIENYETVGKIIAGLVITYGTYRAALLVTIVADKAKAASTNMLNFSINALTASFNRLTASMMKNPYALLAAAIVGVVYAIYSAHTQTNAFTEAQEKLAEANKNVEVEAGKEITKLDELKDRLDSSKKGSKEWKSVKDAIISQYGQYDSKLAAEIERTGSLTSRYNALTKAIKSSVAARQLKDFYDTNSKETETKIQEHRKEIYDALLKKYDKKSASVIMSKINKNADTGTGLKDALYITQNGKKIKTDAETLISRTTIGFTGHARKSANEMRDLRKSFNEMYDNYLSMNNISKEVADKELFGIANTKEDKHVTKNKKFYEDKRKDAQAKLEALSDVAARGKEGAKLKKEIASYDKIINDAFSTNKGGKSASSSKEVQKIDDISTAQRKAIKEYELNVLSQIRETELNLRQHNINLKKDSYEKEREQIELNYDRLIAENEKRRKEMIEALKSNKVNEWLNKNPKATKKQQDNYRNSLNLTDKDLNVTQKAQLDEYDNIAEKQREEAIKKLNEAQINSLNAYLKEYGSIQEKRLAISKEYDEKISKAQTEGERLSLNAQKAKALSDFDFNLKKENLNWEDVFGDLSYQTIEKLSEIKAHLRDMLSSENLDVEGYKAVVEQIDKVNDAITTAQEEQQPFFNFATEHAKERKKLEREVADALERQNILMSKANTLSNTISAKRKSIGEMLAGSGYSGDVSSANITEILGKVAGKFGTESNQYKEVQKAMEDLATSEIELENINKKRKKSDEDVVRTQGKLNKFLDSAIEKLKGFVEAFEQINANISELPELIENLGIGSDTKIGQGVGQLAQASSDGLNAVKDFQSGNFVGAVSKGISAIGNLVNAGLNLFGGGQDSDANLEKDIERLTLSNEALKDSIDNLSTKMKDSSVIDATDIHNEQIKKLEEAEKNTREMMVRSAGASKSGFGGSHSSAYRIDKGVSLSEWKQISNTIGKTVKSAGDFFHLSSEQMGKVASELPSIYAHIKDLANDGYKDAAQFMDDYLNYSKQLKEIDAAFVQKLTSTSFESIENDFSNALMNMESDVSTFADNFEKYMQQAIISSLMSEQYKPLLEKWYKAFGAYMKNDGTIDKEEMEKLKSKGGTYVDAITGITDSFTSWNDISAQALKQRDAMKQMFDWNSESKQQSGSSRGFAAMSQDVGMELNGRFTAAVELLSQIRDNTKNPFDKIDLNMQVCLLNQNRMSEIAVDTRKIIADSYLELVSIRENTSAIIKPIKEMRDDIAEVKKYTSRL